jgi:hypothetical protein
MKDFFKDLKNQIVTGIGVIMATLGTVFIDTIKEKLGLVDEEPAQTEQVIQQPAQPQEIIINMPEQKPVETKTVIVKEVEKKEPKKKTETEKRKDEGLDW